MLRMNSRLLEERGDDFSDLKLHYADIGHYSDEAGESTLVGPAGVGGVSGVDGGRAGERRHSHCGAAVVVEGGEEGGARENIGADFLIGFRE